MYRDPETKERKPFVAPQWVDGQLVEAPLVLDAVVGDDELLPKEQWLIDYCRAERDAGRKVLVYLRQTGTRDIQPRLVNLLQQAGLRAMSLPHSVAPRKREAWLKKKVKNIDVLLTNPKMAETGLDLIDFATVTFYEIEYSLYTMWQAMRRVWRLGQTQAVKVVFAVYEGTLEFQALALMGQKMKAAMQLYGDAVSGAIVEDTGDDLLSQLARNVIAKVKLTTLGNLFAQENKISGSITGNPVVKSRRLTSWAEIVARRSDLISKRRKKQKEPKSNGQRLGIYQPSLFGDEPAPATAGQ